MKFIKLTDGIPEEPNVIYVNLEKVCDIYVYRGRTCLNFSENHSTFVNESLAEVMALAGCEFVPESKVL